MSKHVAAVVYYIILRLATSLCTLHGFFLCVLIGSTMFLEETSLMPPIPGLLALLSMLFAPAIELRYSHVFKVSLFTLRPSQICVSLLCFLSSS